MDAFRFDSLTRSLSAAGSRRAALSTLLGGILGLLELNATAKKKGNGKKGNGKGNGKDKNKKKDKKDTKQPPCADSRPRCGEVCCEFVETCVLDGFDQPRCVHHCVDRMHNFDETDLDCGGSCRFLSEPLAPRTCSVKQGCKVNEDCVTGICAPVGPGGSSICGQCRNNGDCVDFSLRRTCVGSFCHECASDTDCPRLGQPAAQQFCIEPVNGDCPPNQPCVCRQCRAARDCLTGQTCDETGTCTGGECLTDPDCALLFGGFRPVCVSGECQECRVTSDCQQFFPGTACQVTEFGGQCR